MGAGDAGEVTRRTRRQGRRIYTVVFELLLEKGSDPFFSLFFLFFFFSFSSKELESRTPAKDMRVQAGEAKIG
jgi:hypothetical protein